MTSSTILLVEDNEDDAFFMARALKDARIQNPLQHVENGQAAIDYLGGTGRFADRDKHPLPMVVFLDLKLPLKSGHEVLSWIRSQPPFEKLVTIILTSSEETMDVRRTSQLGANSYMVKPPTPKQLLDLAEPFCLRWLRQNEVNTMG